MEEKAIPQGAKSLFDGKTLVGWHAVPRIPTPNVPGGREPDKTSEHYKTAASTSGKWEVVDGVISGGQGIRGYGGYLLTDGVYGDFDLWYDAKPDWPVDTGVYIRTTDIGTQGFQILLDHRKSGGIGGFYGNGIGGFHGVNFNVDAKLDAAGKPCGLVIENASTTIEPITDIKREILSYAMSGEEFLKIWKWNDWNTFRVHCEGEYPVLTSWINGVKAYELDTGAMQWPGYDKEAVRKLLGRKGHIAFEVHDNDPVLKDARWAPGNVCRWRNIYIKEL
jgi:hypothetical protein